MQVGKAEPLRVVNRRPKITVVGAGNVGATAAQYIVEKELGDVVLVDVIDGIPQGKALDLAQAGPVHGYDSALIGAGTYADSSLGGVSCTGDGEAIVRVVLAHRALAYLKDADDPDYAAKVAVDLLTEEGDGQGGLILIDWRGRAGYATSTRLMPVAIMSPTLDEPRVPF